MEEEKKVEEVVQEIPLVDYVFGDLYVTCKCGNEDLIAEGIKSGIRFDIFTTNKHTVKLGCKACGAQLSLGFKEAKNIEELKTKMAEQEKLREQEVQDEGKTEPVDVAVDEEMIDESESSGEL
jgi:hypothetical protein